MVWQDSATHRNARQGEIPRNIPPAIAIEYAELALNFLPNGHCSIERCLDLSRKWFRDEATPQQVQAVAIDIADEVAANEVYAWVHEVSCHARAYAKANADGKNSMAYAAVVVQYSALAAAQAALRIGKYIEDLAFDEAAFKRTCADICRRYITVLP